MRSTHRRCKSGCSASTSANMPCPNGMICSYESENRLSQAMNILLIVPLAQLLIQGSFRRKLRARLTVFREVRPPSMAKETSRTRFAAERIRAASS